MSSLPAVHTLNLMEEGGVLHVILNRPEVRNAMNLAMVHDLEAVLDTLPSRSDVRSIVIRGTGGHFCAGADIQDLADALSRPLIADEPDPIVQMNRRFGAMLTKLDESPQAVVAVLEGAVLGAGLGVACAADVVIALADTSLGMPEATLGMLPAQIAPFVIRRIGSGHMRRLVVTGSRLNAEEARRVGFVHDLCDTPEALASKMEERLTQIGRCAPGAIAITKNLIRRIGEVDSAKILDEGAACFAAAVRGPEGREGIDARAGKRQPAWVRTR